jgi:hypothetical protein
LEIVLPPGTYTASWTFPEENRGIDGEVFSHEGGTRLFKTPIYPYDIALSIRAAV